MKNITLKLDDAILDRVRHVTVDEHVSVSAWVQNAICRELGARDMYEQDRKGALMILREGLPLGGRPLTREAAARRAGVSTLWSEDFNTGQDFDAITVVNPLA